MRKTYKLNKLVRDKSHEQMLDSGAEVKLIIANSEADKIRFFKEKIIEEATEVKDAKTNSELIEEMADCLEVLHGLSKVIAIDFAQIEQVRLKKKAVRGGFEKCIIIDSVTLNADKEMAKYCQVNPEKYPEVANGAAA